MWGCFKHVGMSWEMAMSLPIQERRALISKHNQESESMSREIQARTGENNMHVEGDAINNFARRSQNDIMGG